MPINEWSESILIAQLSDEPAFSEDMDALHRRLEKMDGELPDVILSLDAVTYLNSTNIAQILRVRKKLLDSTARIRVCSVSDKVWSVLLATGLDRIFEVTEDVSTSLASLQIGDL